MRSSPSSASSTTARAPDFAFLELDLLKVKGQDRSDPHLRAARRQRLQRDPRLQGSERASHRILEKVPGQRLGRGRSAPPRMRQDERLQPPPALCALQGTHRVLSAQPSPARLGRDRGSSFQIAHAQSRLACPRRRRRAHAEACGGRLLSPVLLSISAQGHLRPSRRPPAQHHPCGADPPRLPRAGAGIAAARRRHRRQRVPGSLPRRLVERAAYPPTTTGRRNAGCSGSRSAPTSSFTA